MGGETFEYLPEIAAAVGVAALVGLIAQLYRSGNLKLISDKFTSQPPKTAGEPMDSIIDLSEEATPNPELLRRLNFITERRAGESSSEDTGSDSPTPGTEDGVRKTPAPRKREKRGPGARKYPQKEGVPSPMLLAQAITRAHNVPLGQALQTLGTEDGVRKKLAFRKRADRGTGVEKYWLGETSGVSGPASGTQTTPRGKSKKGQSKDTEKEKLFNYLIFDTKIEDVDEFIRLLVEYVCDDDIRVVLMGFPQQILKNQTMYPKLTGLDIIKRILTEMSIEPVFKKCITCEEMAFLLGHIDFNTVGEHFGIFQGLSFARWFKTLLKSDLFDWPIKPGGENDCFSTGIGGREMYKLVDKIDLATPDQFNIKKEVIDTNPRLAEWYKAHGKS